jgi:glycosyltransferase involved in cell wall biosynthesis
VLARTLYPASAASARVRVASFRSPLADHGIELDFDAALTPKEHATLVGDRSLPLKLGPVARGSARALRSALRSADVHLVHRLAGPVRLPGLERRKIGVYDFDDALFIGSMSRANVRFERLKDEHGRWGDYVRAASVVTAGNAYLADAARPLARRVEIVPSCVDPAGQRLRVHGDVEILTIGWIGSPSTAAYLRPVVRAVEQLRGKGMAARLVVVGAEIDGAPPWVEQRRWSEESQEADLRSFDVGVMPLPDDPWTRGKCGYKLLQYLNAGVPAVVSSVGVNRDIVLGSGAGALVEREEDWVDALAELIGDPAARAERGAAGRRFAEREFSYEVWTPRLAELLRDAADR